MTKYIFGVFVYFAFTSISGCGGLGCTYSLYREQLKERMKSPSCIKTYDTIDNNVWIEVTDTLTGELLCRKIKALK